MTINLSKDNVGVIERGVYYFALSDEQDITISELKDILAFIKYEKMYGRETKIACQNENILATVNHAILNPETIENAVLPAHGAFIYHATSIEAMKKILSSGKLLSAVKVYGKTGSELALNKSDSTWNDPADYFEHIMFCWGDNPTGDYVVLSENFPNENDLIKGNFNAGIRFYFRYEDMCHHPGYTDDGYHATKIKDEIVLSDYFYACIVPEQYRNELKEYDFPQLMSKVHYLPQKGLGLAEWNEKAYDFVSMLPAGNV